MVNTIMLDWVRWLTLADQETLKMLRNKPACWRTSKARSKTLGAIAGLDLNTLTNYHSQRLVPRGAIRGRDFPAAQEQILSTQQWGSGAFGLATKSQKPTIKEA